MDYILLVIGFVLLIKGADWLIHSSSVLAQSFGISPLVIGLSVVAFGTSAPELAIGIISGIQRANQVAFGDVTGSSIANIALIIGVSAIIQPLAVDDSAIKKEMPISFGIQILLLFLVLFDGEISTTDGILLLIFFIAYVTYLFLSERKKSKFIDEPIKNKEILSRSKRAKLIVWLLIGLAALFQGGDFVVTSSVNIARTLGWNEELIGITVVAFGTSLPELITCLTAVIKKEHDIAIGNIIGSNIFNILVVLGVSSSIHRISLSGGVFIDLFVMLGLTLTLFAISTIFKKIHRLSGLSFILIYAGFITYKIVSM